jgi:aspartyl-tRNA(Asn)/glutamyl-tRNA(Gln) amidotransferase subunit A
LKPDTMPEMLTSLQRVEASLAAIAEHGGRTNAFISVDIDGAIASARAADEERRRGLDRGPLHGMPISIKDLIDIEGLPTTAASRVRADHVASGSATLVLRLREAGAVLIGKTNLHEFALGPTTDASAWGPVRNPHDTTRSAGGSSGGSAAAVALRMGEASIGSDTGGSIRIPAAACGVVGLKPTRGEIPLDGVVPLSPTLDHAGPISQSVREATALWAVLARAPLPALDRPPGSFSLGRLDNYFMAYLDEPVRDAFHRAIESLERAGTKVTDITISSSDKISTTYTNISLPEAAHWHAPTLDSKSADYQPSVRERLLVGRSISAVDYLEARSARLLLHQAVDAALDGCDALVLPTLPIVAPILGATEVAFQSPAGATLPVRAAMLRLTQLFNITGHPAISIPIPTTGLPVGLQLVGRFGDTPALLAVASTCERLLADQSGA